MRHGLATKEDLAEGLLQSLYNMDEGIEESRGFAMEVAIERIGPQAIHFVWAENVLWSQIPELKAHLKIHPNGMLDNTLRKVIDLQVVAGVDTIDGLYKKYGFAD
jgi:hypothetical protein